VPVPVPTAGGNIITPSPQTDPDCRGTYELSLQLAAQKNGTALLALEQRTSPQCMIPVIKFRRAQYPYIARHVFVAEYQRNKPMLLTFNGSRDPQSNANRTDVCTIPQKRTLLQQQNDPNLTMSDHCDEYPYASTMQGGIAGYPGVNPGTSNGPSMMMVPAAENRSQGGRLTQFYQGRDDNRRGVAMQRGDPFAVVAIMT